MTNLVEIGRPLSFIMLLTPNKYRNLSKLLLITQEIDPIIGLYHFSQSCGKGIRPVRGQPLDRQSW